MVSHYFYFFWISYARFGTRIKMTAHETPAQIGGVECHFNGNGLVNKWHVADPKMIFAKNHELILIELKGNPTPIPTKSPGAYVKSRN
jgi:hypothetical protein